MSGIELIAAERNRQLTREGWTPAHDDEHEHGELGLAAVAYVASAISVPCRVQLTVARSCSCRSIGECQHIFGVKKWGDPWPFESSADKRDKHDDVRKLEIAAALIAAEIDRRLRQRERQTGGEATR
jgi:hypothetical protein